MSTPYTTQKDGDAQGLLRKVLRSQVLVLLNHWTVFQVRTPCLFVITTIPAVDEHTANARFSTNKRYQSVQNAQSQSFIASPALESS